MKSKKKAAKKAAKKGCEESREKEGHPEESGEKGTVSQPHYAISPTRT